MSFQNKPGKTRSWRKMVIRQQLSDVLAYDKIVTTLTKAKETQRFVDRMVTYAKKNTLASRRQAARYILSTSTMTSDEILKKLFNEIGPKYKNRNGGYTRVLKLGSRPGDNTEEAIIELV